MSTADPAVKSHDNVTLLLAARPSSPREARRRIGALASTWAAECVATLEVLVGELVTNAVVHAQTDIQLDAWIRGERARVEVRDRSVSELRMRTADAHAIGGRGLRLVAKLADGWGVASEPDGKVVWFEFVCDRPEVPS